MTQADWQLRWRSRFTWWVHGILLPLVLIGMSLSGFEATVDRPWQSGRAMDYAAMLLKPLALAPLAPAIALCMASLASLTIWPQTSQTAWGRLGIATGVLLSLQYALILVIAQQGFPLMALIVVWPAWHGALWLLSLMIKPQRQFHIWHLLVAMTIAAVLAGLLRIANVHWLGNLMGALMLTLPAVPLLNFLTYSSAAWRIFLIQPQSASTTLRRFVIGLCIWLPLWLTACRWSILVMLDEYSKLPTTNPNCYLSNAAAYAHPCLTGADKRGAITMAMKRLKFLELVIKAISPRLHDQARRMYDRYCPPLAGYCRQHHWSATLTCLAIKPLELVAEGLRSWLQIDRRYVAQIYARNAHPTMPLIDSNVTKRNLSRSSR